MKSERLGDYITIKHGYAFKGKYISTEDNGVVLVTPGNFKVGGGFKEDKCKFFTNEYPDEYVLHSNDLIVTMTDLSKAGDTLGYSAKIPSSDRVYLHNQRVGLVFINNPNLDKDYLYWFLRTPFYQKAIVSTASGSTVKHTSPSRIYDIEIDVPNLEIQKKIAGVLSNIEDKMELNRVINNNLEQQAQAIYSEIFSSENGDLWPDGVLSDIAEITMGQSPSGSSYNEEGIGTVFFQGRAEFGRRFPTVRLFTTEPKHMACANDVLMSVRAPVGDLNVASVNCCIGRGLAAIHSKDDHQSYVFYTMVALRSKLDIFNGEGTVFGSINKSALNSMKIKLPPKELLDKFESLVAPMDNLIRLNNDEICHLQALRDLILPRLIDGEIDVTNIDI